MALRFQLCMSGPACAAGLASRLGQGVERPRPGSSEKSQGLSRLLGWPLGSWGLFSVASKVKEPYILPRASVALLLSHMGDCLRRRDAPEHPEYHFIDTKLFSRKPKPGFPEHQSSFDPLQNILAGSFRVRRGPIIPEFPSSKEPRKSPSTLSPHPRLSVAVTVLSYLRY